jgi:hypothetical protein
MTSSTSNSGPVRSQGENLPKASCSNCRALAHEHPVVGGCQRFVIQRGEMELHDPLDDHRDPFDDDWEVDRYEEAELRIPRHLLPKDDEEFPSWLEAAGMSLQDWKNQLEAEDNERERQAEERRLGADTAALTAHWRSELADKPADGSRPRRASRRK